MRIHHLRNATMVVESKEHKILIDPMLGPKGSIPPFTLLRFRPKMNPLVDLPANSSEILAGITHCLITHSRALGIRLLQHQDHLDSAGERFLREATIPVTCPSKDAAYLRKLGLRVGTEVNDGQTAPFLDGQITAVPCVHGYGWIHKLMANGAGYILDFPDEPTLYISGDTIYTQAVKRALQEHQPDISVVAAGSAQLDIGRPLLMNMDDILAFIQDAPGQVIANHLECLNHCPTTREHLRSQLEQRGLSEKVFIPEDGETLVFES